MLAADDSLLALARESVRRYRAYERRTSASELLLDGTACGDLICWPHILSQPCTCAGDRAHLWRGACAGAVNEALGNGRRGCRFGRARCHREHLDPAQIRNELEAWWRAHRHGKTEESIWSTASRPNSALHGGGRSTATSTGRITPADVSTGITCSLCSSDDDDVLARLRRRTSESPYLARFLDSPALVDAFMAHDGLRALLSWSKFVKELTEAFAAAERTLALLARLRARARGDGGLGVVLLDCCCGKGLTAALLSLLLPRAEVIMLDANGGMGLSHCRALPNVRFLQLDLLDPAITPLDYLLITSRLPLDCRCASSSSTSSTPPSSPRSRR